MNQSRRTNFNKRQYIYNLHEGQCAYCGIMLNHADGKWEMDHVIPKRLGGGNGRSNLVLSCSKCNRFKADKTLEQFREIYFENSNKTRKFHYEKRKESHVVVPADNSRREFFKLYIIYGVLPTTMAATYLILVYFLLKNTCQ